MSNDSKPTERDVETARDMLYRATHCPICGRPMVHYRLRGYRCHDERHNEQAAELARREIEAEMRKGRRR